MSSTFFKQELTPPSETLDGTDSPPQGATYARAACTECSRRKQKCNREWPCDHCKKRKVGTQCRYNHSSLSGSKAPAQGSAQDVKRKRDRSEESVTDEEDSPSDEAVGYGGEAFEALGYSTVHLFSRLTTRDEPKTRKSTSKQYFRDKVTCPQLERALRTLPPRPYCDSLVQNFLSNVNYHYYIIYPSNFLEEYQAWWKDRAALKPLDLQWMCLLMMICACSCQYTDVELQGRLEEDLGESVQKLSERYHNAGRELHSVIPVGHNHLLKVQALLHSCYWYKGEVRSVECWHVLASAIREAQELGIHQESIAGPIPEFEREMRRRVWCVLNTWDWQMSSLLGRQMIIDRSDCDIGLPSLSLEDFDPSPMLHMKLSSHLIEKVAHTFGLLKYVVLPDDVQRYHRMIETWTKGFPKWYDIDSPDQSQDRTHPWIQLHRHYLHTMAFSMILETNRTFLAKAMSRQTEPVELEIRRDGIDNCLRLVKALYRFFNYVYPRDSKFHFVIFCLFDTASVMCSTIIHDQDNSAPRKHDMLDAIDRILAKLKKLSDVTDGAKTSHEVLNRIVQRAKAAAGQLDQATGSSQRATVTEAPGVVVKDSDTFAVTPALANGNGSGQVVYSVGGDGYNNDMGGNQSQVPSMTPAPYPAFPQAPQAPIPPLSQDGYRAPEYPQPVNYSFAPHYPMQNQMPPTTYATPNPLQYAMNPMTDLRATTTTMNGHQIIPTSYDNVASMPAPQQYMGEMSQMDYGPITEEELGQLAAQWQYRSLNFDFINPKP